MILTKFMSIMQKMRFKKNYIKMCCFPVLLRVNYNLLKKTGNEAVCPKMMFLPFFSKIFHMTVQPLKISEK